MRNPVWLSSRLIRTTQQCRYLSDARPFVPGDLVLLRPTSSTSHSPILSKPLKDGLRLDTHKGTIPHASVIGKHVRDVVRPVHKTKGINTARGAEYRLHEVKLEEYVRFTRRLVTPLYPQDAQLIVGLLDLHPEPARWGEKRDEGEKLEILEAGTGHGALTLFLSRAVHAANPPHPRPETGEEVEDEAEHIAIEAWKSTRCAIIHSIEVSPTYSAHAEKIVKGFRHGMYYHNVDFHVGDVSEWVTSTLTQRNKQPFLSHAFLDLPNADSHLSTVAKALRIDGALIVFNPSITQITACLERVKKEGIPLELERVVELGVNGGTGGREWDVRAVRPRAIVKKKEEEEAALAQHAEVRGEEKEGDLDSGVELRRDDELEANVGTKPGDESVEAVGDADDDWKMVCRPKVGGMIVGGGFLGVFRKQRHRASD